MLRGRPLRRVFLSLAITFAVAAPCARALAQPPEPPPSEGGAAAAESLFQDARRLTIAKKYGEACPKFLASQKLQPAIGTLLNLADCYEKNGQLASAWARFHEAIALAQRLGRADREATAKDRADKLEPRLLRLTVKAASPSVTVSLDGNPLDPAVLGTPVPVDPGKHTIEAQAKGKKPYTTTIEIAEKDKTSSLDIPTLEDQPASEPKPPPPVTEPPAEPKSTWSTQKTLGLAAVGAGIVGAGVGTVFGLMTSSKWKDAQSHCNDIYECDETGVTLGTDAKNAGTISTVAFIAGGALVVLGAVVFFTAPSAASTKSAAPRPPPRKLDFGLGPGSATLWGTF